MSDVNAGEVKAIVKIEYDGAGIDKAKEDLTSLAEMGGNVGEGMGGAGEALTQFGEQAGSSAESAKSFTEAIAELPKITESSTSGISAMTDAMSEQQSVIEDTTQSFSDTLEPLTNYHEALQSLSETVSSPHLTENMAAFQDALENPYPFQMIGQYLNETGQSWGDFTSTIGESNTSMLHEMATNADVSHQVLGGMNNVFHESANSAQEFTDQFNSVAESVGKANAGINAFGGAGNVLAGPLEELQGYRSIGFGEAFSGASEGIMGALNDVAMPLMAVQMIAMVVGQVGQSIYDAAAIAEGPAAHSFGTFTGTVDALGQSAAQAGQQFSEAFGQGVLPSLNALNYQTAQMSPGTMGGIGGSLGMATGFLADLWQIGTGFNVQGGFEGLANLGAQIIGVQQPFQGPGPQSQVQVSYQQAFARMPQTVATQAYQTQTQADQYLQMASDPSYLAAQDQMMAAQQAYQHAQATYNSRHYISPQQALMSYQEQQYDVQQAANYQQQMQSQGLFSGVGSGIGGFFGGLGQLWNSSIGLAGQDWNTFMGLFGGGSQPITSGGCFPAGTRVLLANGDEKPIEALQVGEDVLGHDGEKQRATTVVALIKPPPKQVYKLMFSGGRTLTLTDSHPLAGVNGWKSISPKATKLEVPELDVSTLEVGDVIHTVNGVATPLSITPCKGVVQVYNITVGEPHTFYADGVLVHNKMGFTSGGEGTEQVSLAHTFTAQVTWEAQNLEKEFQGIASWAGQNLENTFQGVASWAGQGLENTFQGVASWIGEGLTNEFQGVASWIGQGLENTFQGVASWVGEALENTFTGVASWIGQGLTNEFKGVASWVGEDLEHTFNAVASWTAQNLTPSFIVNPSVTMLAEGASNFAGGPAIVAEAGYPEVVEHNGQFSLFNQAALLNLPPGANVYPMKNMSVGGGSPVSTFADGTGDPIIPITLGMSGGAGNNALPQSINVVVQLDSQSILSAIQLPMAANIRVQSGMRGF